ncbi:MAG: ATP-grasp fold amidoligase family protein [Actinomycetota bacterium]
MPEPQRPADIDDRLTEPWQQHLLGRFEERHGRLPELREPRRISDKTAHRILFDRDPLYAVCANKITAPAYAAAKAGPDLCFATRFGFYETITPDDIAALPDRFALKGSHASGVNVMVEDKAAIDVDEVCARLNARLRTVENAQGRNDPEALLIAEELLRNADGTEPADYKFHCFRSPDGELRWILRVTLDRSTDPKKRLYTQELELLTPQWGRYRDEPAPFEAPAGWERMVRIVEALSEDFDYMRIDLYDVDGEVYFGEFTPFHSRGLAVAETEEFDVWLGDHWTPHGRRTQSRSGLSADETPPPTHPGATTLTPGEITEEWQRAFLRRFETTYGRPPVLDGPRNYTDKMAWRILFDHDPLYPLYGNKLFAPYYAAARAGTDLAFATRYGVYHEITRDDVEQLPNRFFLKASHSSGLNEMVPDRDALDSAELDDMLARFNHGVRRRQNAQGRVDPSAVTIAEEWLDDGTGTVPIDYKFHCFRSPDGELRWLLHLVRDRYGTPVTTLYDDELRPFPAQWGRMPLTPVPFEPPDNWEQTVRVADALSADFDYVRVDLHNLLGRTYLGEITVFHEGGKGVLLPSMWDRIIGDMWIPHRRRLAPRFTATPGTTNTAQHRWAPNPATHPGDDEPHRGTVQAPLPPRPD